MKKILLFLLVLGMAGGLFAQGFTFTGEYIGGVGAFFGDSKEDVTPTTSFDTVGDATRLRVTGAYENADKTAGIKFRLQGTSDKDWNTIFNYGYGWVKGLGGKLTLTGGKVNDGTWGAAANKILDGGDWDEGSGLLLILNPTANFNIGGAVYAGSKYYDTKYVGGLGFTAPNLLKLSLTYANRLANLDATPTTTIIEDYAGHHIQLDVQVLAIKGVTIDVAARAMDLKEFSDYGRLYFYETFGYTTDKLAAFLVFQESKLMYEDNFHFYADLDAEYAVTNTIVPGIGVRFQLNGKNSLTSLHHFKNIDIDSIGKENISIAAQPRVQFKFDKGSLIEVGYLIDVNMANSTTALTNAVYADLKVSF